MIDWLLGLVIDSWADTYLVGAALGLAGAAILAAAVWYIRPAEGRHTRRRPTNTSHADNTVVIGRAPATQPAADPMPGRVYRSRATEADATVPIHIGRGAPARPTHMADDTVILTRRESR
jgi:hypothetical protein